MELKNGKYTFDDLVDIVAKLRAPDGCPWDREQTHDSIRKNMIEEAYELVEAIDGGKPEKVADESGDVLLQVVLHAQIAKDGGEYEIDDVTDAICRKLIHRHPHVFGEVEVKNSAEVMNNWDAIKRADREQSSITEELRGVSGYLPSLMRAQKILKKAKKAGYSPKPAECTEHAKTEEEVGKLLLEIAAACNENGVDAEVALSGCINKFIYEFEKFEKQGD